MSFNEFEKSCKCTCNAKWRREICFIVVHEIDKAFYDLAHYQVWVTLSLIDGTQKMGVTRKSLTSTLSYVHMPTLWKTAIYGNNPGHTDLKWILCPADVLESSDTFEGRRTNQLRQKQQLQIEAAEFQQQQDALKIHAKVPLVDRGALSNCCEVGGHLDATGMCAGM